MPAVPQTARVVPTLDSRCHGALSVADPEEHGAEMHHGGRAEGIDLPHRARLPGVGHQGHDHELQSGQPQAAAEPRMT